jgi:hypothetical protein
MIKETESKDITELFEKIMRETIEEGL